MDDLQETTTATVTKPYDNVGGKMYPRVKMTFGVDGTANDVSSSNPLPVTFAGTSPVSGTVSVQGTIPVSMSGSGTTSISGTVPISGNVGITGTVPVSLTNGGTTAISGTVPVSISGTPSVTLAGTPTFNPSGTQNVTLNSLQAGEDLVADLTKVEQRFTPYFINSAGTATIKTAAGLIHTLTVTGGSAGAITGYDSSSGTSATKLFDFDSTNALATYTFNFTFATGLVVVTGAATKLSISKR